MTPKSKIVSLIELLVFTLFLFSFYFVSRFGFDRFASKVRLDDARYYIIFEFLFFISIALAVFATQKIFKTKILSNVFISNKWGLDILLGFSIGAIFMLVTMALAYMGGAYVPDTKLNLNINFAVPLTFFLFVGLAEELIFRGFIFNVFEKGFGTKWSMVITSLLFGFFHMVNTLEGIAEDYKPLACLFLAIEAGFLLNVAFLIRRSLWIPVGIHWSWNLFETSIFGAKEGQIHFLPSLITGHYQPGLFLPGYPMGMESSYITLFTGVATALILMRFVKSNDALRVPQNEKSQK